MTTYYPAPVNKIDLRQAEELARKKSETSKYAISNISSAIRIGKGLETIISLLVDFRGFLFPIENFRSFNQRVAFK